MPTHRTARSALPGKSRNLERERSARILERHAGADLRGLALAVQAAHGFVPAVAHALLAERTGLDEADVAARIEADEGLRAEPACRHRITICTGRTCARRGGAGLVRAARHVLGVELFETTSDGAIHIEPFRCFGQCAMAPNVRIDGGVRGAMGADRFRLLLDVYRKR